jgi:AcrR family transcriptional regulator
LAQTLKEDVQRLIREAALEAFATEGYAAASIAKIAGHAGVSTGNVYRYFENKEVLFLDVVPEALAAELKRLVKRRIDVLRGTNDLDEAERGGPWRAVSGELLDLAIAHRLAVVVLLDRSKAAGTVHEGFAEAMVADLTSLAIRHAKSVSPSFEPTAAERLVLERVYAGLVDTMVAILGRYRSADAIRDAVDRFSTYHLAGLRALLERRT